MNSKDKKNRPLSLKSLNHYRDILNKEKNKILKSANSVENHKLTFFKESSGELSRYSTHMADQGTDNNNRELELFTFGNEHEILYQIDNALRRIDDETYGICEMLKTSISKKRLDAIPWTPFCKEAAEQFEKNNKK